MTKIANLLWSPGLSKGEVARRVASQLEGRSAEAIAKRLRLVQWTPPEKGNTLRNATAWEEERNERPSRSNTSAPDADGQAVHEPPTQGASCDRGSLRRTQSWRKDLLRHSLAILREDGPVSRRLKTLADRMLTAGDALGWAEDEISMITDDLFPDRWVTRPPKRIKPWATTKRAIRRAQYATIQRLLKIKKKDAAHRILDGSWRLEPGRVGNKPEGLEEYWRGILESPKGELRLELDGDQEWEWSIVDPVSEEEVRGALKSLRKSSTGVDKITANDLLRWERGSAAALMNILLAAGMLPRALSVARITLIPKVETPDCPGDFRPIAITPIFTRALHKILAFRIRDTVKFSSTQFAFLKRDGCLEASYLLQALLRQAHDENTPTALLLLDLSKAFDTVDHNAILRAATKAGIPPPLLHYLSHQYSTATVKLGEVTIPVNRGVRQGDPLSPLLFILVMEEVVAWAKRDLGVLLGSVKIDSLAYADDLVLAASNHWDLQRKLEGLQKGLQKVGLSLNHKKSRSITIAKDGKRKTMLLLPKQYSTTGGEISAMSTEDEARYLGLTFTWKGMVKPRHTLKLQHMLEELRRAPLKPYQRMELLNDFALPRLTHELVLGRAHRNTLGAMDKMVRAAVRSWLRLPKDTPLGFIHASIHSGGLNVRCLGTSIPLLQKARMEKIINHTLPITSEMITKNNFSSMLKAVNRPVRIAKEVVTSKEEAKAGWARALHAAVDGKDLAETNIDQASHRWLTDPSRVFPRLHMRGIQLRGGLLPTKSRQSRGRGVAPAERTCRGLCGTSETLNHILQVCHTTHDARCARHNRVMRLLEKKLRGHVTRTFVEPIIKTGVTFIKPDIVALKGEETIVLDVTVVSTDRLEESWRLKVRKYDSPENRTAIQRWDESQGNLEHLPIVITNRGMLYGPSGRGLRAMGLSERDLSDLCLLTIQGSINTFDCYMNNTTHLN